MREIKFRFWDTVLREFTKYYSAPPQDIFEFNQERYIALQYTGLLDKNGKEIYERDIVKIVSNDHPKIVEWVDRYCGFNIRPNRRNARGYEVIGNIYENPELLEAKKAEL